MSSHVWIELIEKAFGKHIVTLLENDAKRLTNHKTKLRCNICHSTLTQQGEERLVCEGCGTIYKLVPAIVISELNPEITRCAVCGNIIKVENPEKKIIVCPFCRTIFYNQKAELIKAIQKREKKLETIR